jgi:uncharacterized protein YndB with AHSA1/START domain
MTKETGSATINAPVAEVFDFARDVGRLWSSMGVAVEDVRLTPDGVGSSADWASKMLGVPIKGRVEFIEVVPNERIRAESSTGPQFLFTFDSLPEGATKLGIECDYHFGVPMIGDRIDELWARLNPDEMTVAATRVKEQIEGVAAPTETRPGAKLSRSVTINAPVEKVFESALDIGKFWVHAADVAVREDKVAPDGVGSSARLYTHWLGVHFEGVLEVIEVVRNQRMVVKATFGPESPLWTFTFEPVEGGTQLTAEGEWHIGVPAVGKQLGTLMAKSHEDFLEGMLANIKTDLEATS